MDVMAMDVNVMDVMMVMDVMIVTYYRCDDPYRVLGSLVIARLAWPLSPFILESYIYIRDMANLSHLMAI